MKKFLRSFIILVLIIVVAGEGIAIFLLYQENESNKSRIKEFELAKFEKLSFVEDAETQYEGTEYDAIQSIEKMPKDVSEIHATGWIPDWDFSDGFTTLRNNSDFFTGVNPFWYDVNADGTLKELQQVNNQELKTFSANNNIELLPTITAFDTDKISELLNSEENRQRHIDTIIDTVISNNYDGIDLDYESIYLDDKEEFYTLLQQLSLRMIESNKKLTFTSHPKWGDDVYYGGLPQTRMVLDYKRIADLVDELRIMTYEFTGRANIYYGPNAPLDWMEDVIRYAILEGVPRDKIVIGVPTYSYDYTLRDQIPEISYYPVFLSQSDTENAAVAYYNTIVDEVKANNNFREEFNEEWGEMVLNYNFEGKDRVLVYPDSQSIALRKQLAADYGIRGVAFWRLGDEGSLKYN